MLIVNNDEKEIVAEADNKEKVNIKIVNKKIDEPIDDISSVAFIESDDEEEIEEKIYRVCNSTKIHWEESQLIEALQEELDESIFLKRLDNGALHKFYRIKQNKKSSAEEI